MKIRVSNIDRSTMEDELLGLFEEFGDVVSLELNEEPDAGVETFTAWVEMAYQADAEEAITDLNGERVDGRALVVISGPEADKLNLKSTSALDYIDLDEEVGIDGEAKVPLRKAGREGEPRGPKRNLKRGGKR